MIRVIFRGGLGNQMFQYAAGYSLAKRHSTGLILDTSWYHYPIKRKFLLDRLKIEGKRTDSIWRGIINWVTTRPPVFGDNKGKLVPKHNQKCIEEFIDTGPDSILYGSFVSERFFKDSAADIREIYSLENITLPGSTKVLLQDTCRSESVCIHVRLGDYLKYPKFNVCGSYYYENAIRFMRERLKEPVFFVFSDDIQSASKITGTDSDVKFCNHNPTQDPFVDLRLMANCKHHIIANSTFSWWAAWLAQTEDQCVIAPTPWFNSNTDTSNICPAYWHQQPVSPCRSA